MAMAMYDRIEKCSTDKDKHSGDVNKVCFWNDYVFSAGADGKIKVSFKGCVCTYCILERLRDYESGPKLDISYYVINGLFCV